MNAARNGLIDYGRFVAALGFVWFQAQAPGYRVAYIALPFFLVLLSMPSSASLGTRARRFLQPFVTWSVIFGLLQIALARKQGEPPFSWWEPYMLLTGTWIHLWILPFAFLAGLLAPWFRHPLASLGAAWLAALLMVINGTPAVVPFGQWSFGVIPVLVGIAFFSWGWRLAVITLLGSWLILYLGRPSSDNFVILAGTALALVCLSYRLPASAVSDWCARLSVWIYLVNPLVIIAGQSLRITWFELGLFSLVGSVIVAQVIETTIQTSRKGKLEF
ncbi:MAG: hypothetical protein J0L76_09485 [Rhodobacterales bacterium]|nr:hypothetical protein [Rhodobacterales bacterium]